MALASNGKTTLSISESAAQLTRDGASWAGAFSTGATTSLTYGFRANAPTTMPDQTSGFVQFNAQQIRGAELALQSWSDVANLRFTRVGSGTTGLDAYSDSATLRFANYQEGQDGAAAFAYLPSTLGNRSSSSAQGDAWFDIDLSYNANPQMFGYGQRVLVHEIGHTLGLEHPGEYDAGAGSEPITYSGSAQYYEDSRQYTVMSYFSETNTGGNFRGYYASSPQLHDIAAMQKLYGPNMSAFLGDTAYGFGSNADRAWFTAATASSPLIFAVWDAGGTDTFNFSGYSQAQRIDLNAGRFSDVGGMTGNVAVAQGVVIENADGGFGADRILGNPAANFIRGMDGADDITGGGGADDLNGNVGADTVNGGLGADTVFGGQDNDRLFGDEGDDLLSGDLGADTLTGGAGADRFTIRAGGGIDWVTDFSSVEGDRVQLATGTAYSLQTVSGQAVVDMGGGTLLGLAGVSPGSLGDWLVFA